MRPIKLSVLPNPWHTIDHEGRPAGACPRERPATMPGGHQGYVCAERRATQPEKLPPGHQGTPSQDTWMVFSREPREVADPNHYYAKAVRQGELFAADARTARHCGVEFRPYAELLEAARQEAAQKWRAVTGEDLPARDPFAPDPAEARAQAVAQAAAEIDPPKPAKKEGK